MNIECNTFSTVTVAAVATAPGVAYDLADRETLKINLGITSPTTDDFLSRAITQASAAISNYCNRVFNVETLQDQIFPGAYLGPLLEDRHILPLSRAPVVSVLSVTLTNSAGVTSLVQGVDYLLKPKTGELVRLRSDGLGFMRWERSVALVTYQAGYSPIPGDILNAVAIMVRRALAARDRDPSLMEEHQENITRRYWVPGNDAGFFTADARELIENYRAPVI